MEHRDSDALEPATPHTSAVRTPFWQRKAMLVLLAVVAALAVVATTTQTWIHVDITPGDVAQENLSIVGSKVAVAVTALALVALAGSLATTIAGRIARGVTTAIVFLAAAGIVAVVLGIVSDPAAAAVTEVGAATGLEGQGNDASITVFPWIAIAAAVILALVAVLLFWFGRGWNSHSKYDAATTAPKVLRLEDMDQIDRWDSLSRGEDPTE